MATNTKNNSGTNATYAGHDTTKQSPRNYCFGCGLDNPYGIRLQFVLDEKRNSFVCRFKLARRYVGPPGHVHGGIIATVLDEAMAKANKIRGVTALTKDLTVEYVKPVPIGKPLIAEGWQQSVTGRAHINLAELRNEQGEVLARGRGTFISFDAEKMFPKDLKTDDTGKQNGVAKQTGV